MRFEGIGHIIPPSEFTKIKYKGFSRDEKQVSEFLLSQKK